MRRYDATAVTDRLRDMARLSDLAAERRLDGKVDSSPAAVTRRLRRQSELRTACLKWAAIGAAAGLGRR